MTVLVDEAIWPWRGRRWAHLVSDRSSDELHEAARLIGQRRLGFQGDHYDVDEIDRDRAIELGAQAIDSRQLVRRLKSAGLRRAEAKPSWVQLARWPDGVALGDWQTELRHHGCPGLRLSSGLDAFDGRLRRVGLALFVDASRLVALVEIGVNSSASGALSDMAGALTTIDEVVIGEPRAAGDQSIELFVAK